MCCPVTRCGGQGCSGCGTCPLMTSCCAQGDSCSCPRRPQVDSCSCPRRPLEPLRPAEKPYCCPVQSCRLCARDPDQECKCSCVRNKNIVEALACLFRVTKYHLITTLFQLAYHESQPLPRYSRDREWNVMENVKAPYSELHDLKIYDSMYDRCGMPIDPLDVDNCYKILRMMFMGPVLVPDQKTYLMGMLRKLNDHAICPVDLDFLLPVLGEVQLEELVCAIIDQNARAKRFHSGRNCSDLCKLYYKVVSTDKEDVIRKRRRTKAKAKAKPTDQEDDDKKKAPRVSKPPPPVQVFCTRRPPEPVVEDVSVRAESSTPQIRSTASSLRRSSARKNWPTRFSQDNSKGASRRESRISGGAPKRLYLEEHNVQGGDHRQWSSASYLKLLTPSS
ncbi:uncharacterized protein [Drosophila bipectinata]|uniref:uncharacterized protein n=1 Tax=Drosophila bipectinata TaxID=42026 RepID=UPI001C894DDE|nr:uncharacterized protein LOC108128496 [Drosophila bipectinata]